MTLTLTHIPRRIYRKDSMRWKFRALRLSKRLRLEDVASEMGVSICALSRWERGEPSLGEWRAWRALDWMNERVYP